MRSPDQGKRTTSRKFDGKNYPIDFADGYPLLSLSLQSLEALNKKLKTPVSIHHFRPNIVIDGSEPHIEDKIKEFSIGDFRFSSRKNCTRCSIITVNPKTGEKNNEVMQELLKSRKSEKGVIFGQNLTHQNNGTIAVGQSLEKLEF